MSLKKSVSPELAGLFAAALMRLIYTERWQFVCAFVVLAVGVAALVWRAKI